MGTGGSRFEPWSRNLRSVNLLVGVGPAQQRGEDRGGQRFESSALLLVVAVAQLAAHLNVNQEASPWACRLTGKAAVLHTVQWRFEASQAHLPVVTQLVSVADS